MTIDEAFTGRENNFNLIRLAAALLVLFSHSYPLAGHVDAFGDYIRYQSGGGFAVVIFFAISGFLVTRSVLAHSFRVYALSRVLRILPALFVVVLLQMFVLGPALTSLPLGEYFSNGLTWRHIGNTFVFWISYTLPGVFEGMPHTSINASLWTLPVETFMYICLPLLLVLGLLCRWTIVALLAAIAAGYVIATRWYGFQWGNQGGEIVKSVYLYSTLYNGLFFFSGAALWIWRDRVPLSGGLAASLVLLAVLGVNSVFGAFWFIVAVPYVTLYVALRAPVLKLGKMDISYGVYIIAAPVQQTIVYWYGGSMNPWSLSMVATPIVVGLAILSWRYVEEPALRLRRGMQRERKIDASMSEAIS